MKYVVDVNGERHDVTLGTAGVSFGGESVSAHLAEVARTPVFVLNLGDAVHGVHVRRGASRGQYTLWIDGYRYNVEALDERTRAIRDLAVEREAAAGPAPLVAPMPGLVVRILVREGEQVVAGQGLAVVEAMKMENELRAKVPGRVRAVLVEPGTPVEKGSVLIELE